MLPEPSNSACLPGSAGGTLLGTLLVLEHRRNPKTTLKGTLVGLFLGAAGGFFLADYPLADDLHVGDNRLLLTGALGAIGTVLGFTLSVTCAPTHASERLIWSSTP